MGQDLLFHPSFSLYKPNLKVQRSSAARPVLISRVLRENAAISAISDLDSESLCSVSVQQLGVLPFYLNRRPISWELEHKSGGFGCRTRTGWINPTRLQCYTTSCIRRMRFSTLRTLATCVAAAEIGYCTATLEILHIVDVSGSRPDTREIQTDTRARSCVWWDRACCLSQAC